MVQTIFEACLDVGGEDNIEGVLQCVSDRIEVAQERTSKNINSQLLVLSGALVFFMQAGRLGTSRATNFTSLHRFSFDQF